MPTRRRHVAAAAISPRPWGARRSPTAILHPCERCKMDQQAVLDKLQALSIAHETHSHPVVMTCEAQVAALADVAGACTKNLFLKDKKGRLYIVTAKDSTKVDLKVLSARLGTGKGGLRMAPDELIPSVLNVPFGSVTPLAVCQPGAAGVALLLDHTLRSEPRIFVHPLANTATTVLPAEGLETFLRSCGREPVWVDLEAEPAIDRDNPPDLKHIADAAAVLAADSGPAASTLAAGKKATTPAAGKKAGKAASASGTIKGGELSKYKASALPDDVMRLTDEIVSEIKHGLLSAEVAAMVPEDVLRRLKANVAMKLSMMRNAANARGFAAAKGALAAHLSGKWPEV